MITVPVDGPMSWAAREDAAEAAARILLSERAFDGPTTLTAAAAPTFTEIASIAAEVAGRPVETEVVGEDEWVARQVAAGRPETMARFMLGMYQAAADGFFAGTDLLLGELLGREPRSVRDLLTGDSPG